MESELEQDHSIQADVRPVSRFLRFLLASIATLVLGGVILGVARATGMLVGVYERWFPAEPGTQLYGVVRALDRVTEPILRPIRRLLPPVRAGGMAIDLSIIIAILLLEIVVINIIIPAL